MTGIRNSRHRFFHRQTILPRNVLKEIVVHHRTRQEAQFQRDHHFLHPSRAQLPDLEELRLREAGSASTYLRL